MALKKLPKNYAGLVMPLILSVMMTCVVSAVSILRTQGLTPDFIHIWPSAWAISWAVAFPVLLLVLPIVRRLTAMMVEA